MQIDWSIRKWFRLVRWFWAIGNVCRLARLRVPLHYCIASLLAAKYQLCCFRYGLRLFTIYLFRPPPQSLSLSPPCSLFALVLHPITHAVTAALELSCRHAHIVFITLWIRITTDMGQWKKIFHSISLLSYFPISILPIYIFIAPYQTKPNHASSHHQHPHHHLHHTYIFYLCHISYLHITS